MFLAIGLLLFALFLSKDYKILFKVLFTVVYLIIGLTDYLDGKIARKYHVESSIGSRLDALGDSMLFVFGFFALLAAKVDLGGWRSISVLGIAVLYKAANVLLTYARFKLFNMMHTWLSKLVFNTLYMCGPLFIIMEEVPFWFVVGITAGICLHCVEETITLLKMTEYDGDGKGVWTDALLARLKESGRLGALLKNRFPRELNPSLEVDNAADEVSA